MSVLVKAFIAVLLGVLVTAVLDYCHVLTPQINALTGVIVALVFFFIYSGDTGAHL